MRTMRVNWLPLLLLALLPTLTTAAQGPDAPELEQEKLRGTITPQREWWDLRHYDLAVRVDIEKRTIAGTNTVRFQTLKPGRQLQIDLQPPLELTAARFNNQQLTFSRKGNVCLIDLPSELPAGESCELILEY